MIPFLDRLLSREDLAESEAYELFDLLAAESTPPAVVGALVAALRLKGETAGELLGLARRMRERSVRCLLSDRDRLVDVVGTGGDRSGSFNLSTGSALLAAASGARVAKHGGGAVSGRSGSSDVLEALGLSLPMSPAAAEALLLETGFTFLHAPSHHPVLSALAPLRRSLATRTVFNLLGPLTHPAGAPWAVIGACSLEAARSMAGALAGLPIERAFVVHDASGWDEPTPLGPFHLFDVRPGRVVAGTRDPADLGLARCAEADLRGGDAATNARALRAVFGGERGPHRDALLLGASLALEVCGTCASPSMGIELAADALDSRRAAALLDHVAAFGGRSTRRAHV